MKTKASIQLEFRQVTEQAAALKNSAEELQNASAQLEELMNTLSAEWQGESAELYISKCSELAGKLKQTDSDLKRIAVVIQNSAKAYRDAELKALEQIRLKSQ